MQPSSNQVQDKNYFLFTRRLAFREWAEADLALAHELWGSPEVTKFIGGPFSKCQIEARLAVEIENGHKYNYQYWPIFNSQTDAFVGCCGLRPYEPEEKLAEIGLHLSPKNWGQSYGFEAAGGVIRYAFETLGLAGLVAGHHPGNLVSQKLLIKLGFEYFDDQFYAPTGQVHPIYRIVKPE